MEHRHEKVAEINRRLAAVREQLEHWRAQIAEKEQAGVKIWSRDNFQKGDFARIGNHWNEVIRVNAKTLTVPYVNNWSRVVLRRDDPTFLWSWTRPYNEVSGKMTAKEMADKVICGSGLRSLENHSREPRRPRRS
jgi:hypothetical protein